MIRIDAHHHIWRLSRGDYDWLTPELAPLYRDFSTSDLAPLLERHAITGTVLVQAAETLEETQFLLRTALETPWIAGVVGWCDLATSDAAEFVKVLSVNQRLKGLRPMLQDMEDDDFIVSAAVAPGLAAMVENDLRLDALIRPRHLTKLLTLRERFPDLAIVIDHGAKPDIAGGDLAGWARDLRAVAADGVTCCKLSGLVTEAGDSWETAQLSPVAETILDAFGPARVMWGSDWPVVTLAASYDDWVAASEHLLSSLDDADRARIWGATAVEFYGLEV